MSTDGLVHALLLDGKGGARALDWAGVRAWTPSDGALWVNLDFESATVRDWLQSSSAGIASVYVEALTDHDPRPRSVSAGDSLLLIIRGINNNAGSAPEDMISVRAWVEGNRLITLRRRASSSVAQLAGELERGVGPRSTPDLVVALVDRVIDHVVARVDILGDDVAALEDRVLGGNQGDVRAALADQRRRAIALRRFLAPERDALAKLASANVTWLDSNHRVRLGEVADHLMRAVEELDAARDRATVTQEELSSQVAEAANKRLYVLSLITAVFLPLGFVCALLGVNIGGVPFRDDTWAFWALCGLFAVGLAVQWWFFKKRGWL